MVNDKDLTGITYKIYLKKKQVEKKIATFIEGSSVSIPAKSYLYNFTRVRYDGSNSKISDF